MPLAQISPTLSRHFSISFIISGRSSGLHPVSSHSCWLYVRAARPAFARPHVGFHPTPIYIYIYIHMFGDEQNRNVFQYYKKNYRHWDMYHTSKWSWYSVDHIPIFNIVTVSLNSSVIRLKESMYRLLVIFWWLFFFPVISSQHF